MKIQRELRVDLFFYRTRRVDAAQSESPEVGSHEAGLLVFNSITF